MGCRLFQNYKSLATFISLAMFARYARSTVNPWLRSLNHRLRSLNPWLRSLNPWLRSLNHRLRSLNPWLRPLNHRLRSINPWLHSLNHGYIHQILSLRSLNPWATLRYVLATFNVSVQTGGRSKVEGRR